MNLALPTAILQPIKIKYCSVWVKYKYAKSKTQAYAFHATFFEKILSLNLCVYIPQTILLKLHSLKSLKKITNVCETCSSDVQSGKQQQQQKIDF